MCHKKKAADNCESDLSPVRPENVPLGRRVSFMYWRLHVKNNTDAIRGGKGKRCNLRETVKGT